MDENNRMRIKLTLRKHLTSKTVHFLHRSNSWLILEKEIAIMRRMKRFQIGDDKAYDHWLDSFENEFEARKNRNPFPHCPEKKDWKRHVYLTLEDEQHNWLSKRIISFIMILIFISTAAYIAQTIPSLKNDVAFDFIEIFVSIIFTVEYCLKIYCSKNMYLFLVDIMNMADFFSRCTVLV
eukprot:UN28930